MRLYHNNQMHNRGHISKFPVVIASQHSLIRNVLPIGAYPLGHNVKPM